MHTEQVDKVSSGLLGELGAAAPDHALDELERHHILQSRRGARITYVVARDTAGTALGLLPVYELPPPFDASLDPEVLFAGESDAIGPVLYSAGGAGGYRNHLLLKSPLAPPGTARALVSAARGLAAAAGCARLVLPDLDSRQSGWLAEFEPEATAVTVREKAVLPLAWDDFAGYLAALPRKRRWQVRQERRAFTDSPISVREEPLSSVAAELAPLLAQTQRRYGETTDPYEAEFYLNMLAMTSGTGLSALVGYLSRKPVAFSLLHRQGRTWMIRAVGRDYAAPDHCQYFNLTYYEPIARAVAGGAALLDFGTGSLPAKRFRGCRLQPLKSLLIPATPASGR